MMVHHITISKPSEKFLSVRSGAIRVHCSCGTEGGFFSAEDARAYAQRHAGNQSGMNSAVVVDETASAPAPPKSIPVFKEEPPYKPKMETEAPPKVN